MTKTDVAQTAAERMAANAKAEEFGGEAFKWSQPGTTLCGIVLRVKEVTTQHGPAKVAEIKDEQGTIFPVFLNLVIIEQWWERNKVAVGDTVYIQYTGVEGRVKAFTFALERGRR